MARPPSYLSRRRQDCETPNVTCNPMRQLLLTLCKRTVEVAEMRRERRKYSECMIIAHLLIMSRLTAGFFFKLLKVNPCIFIVAVYRRSSNEPDEPLSALNFSRNMEQRRADIYLAFARKAPEIAAVKCDVVRDGA